MRALVRRLLAGAAALAAAATFATPAQAAAPRVAVLVPDATVGAGFDARIRPWLTADRAIEVQNPRMTFELSGALSGVTLFNPEPNDLLCTDDGQPKMTCRLPFSADIDRDPDGGGLEGALRATKDALGETGTLKVTFSGDGVAPVSTTANVAVGEGVDLSGSDPGDTELTAGLGAAFEGPIHVDNKAAIVAHGAAVTMEADYAFQPLTKFSNCYYQGDRPTACVFDQDLAPGRRYGVSLPFRVRTDTRAPSRIGTRLTWMTPDDFANLTRFRSDHGLGSPGTPGTGAKLTLTEQPAAKTTVKSTAKTTVKSAAKSAAAATVKQTDPHPGDDNDQWISVTVTGRQGADLVALGTTVRGAVGRTVPMTVGVRNDGPAAVDRAREVGKGNDPAAVAVVTPPAGTSVTKIPDGCRKATDRNESTKKGVTQYFCETAGLLLPHARTTWTFELKVSRAGSAGLIEVNPACQCGRFTADTDKSNNTAKILLAASGSGSDGSGGGGGLPITGPRTALVGGAGGALVIVGLAGFLLTRRRRTRFEA